MEAHLTLPKHVEKMKLEALLERTSAPCAMEWSVTLERGLRSKKPGQSLEAILQAMQRLELWDREPAINKAQSDMFKLVQGEDCLFATSILLRLVDAFGSGDMQIKLSVVKVFLSLRRNRRRKRRQSDGILFKCSLENRLEILRRVKAVFDFGDVESRALSLVLFGCLADVAKDNADIRYLILSSLVSPDMIQVEASLFAGGCFGELSNDFGYVLLEVLVNLATLSDSSTTLKVLVARAFAHLKSSSSNTCKSYKEGLKLVLGSSEEEFLVAILISLSKLAIRSCLLIPEQVNLLFSFITKEKPLGLRVLALKCLNYVAVKGLYNFPVHSLSVQTLISILNESDSPPALQCGALQILRKVFLYNLRIDACGDMLELSELFKILKNAAQSSIMTKRHIAIRFLVDITSELLAGKEKASDGFYLTILASEVVSLISDEVCLLVKVQINHHKFDLEMEQKIKSFLSLFFVLFQRCPGLGPMVLERMCLLIEKMGNPHDEDAEMVEGDLTVPQDISGFSVKEGKSIMTKFYNCISNIVNTVLQSLNEASTISTEVLDRVELIVEKVQTISSLDCFTRTAFSLSLRSQITKYRVSNESENNENITRSFSTTIQDCLIRSQNLNRDCAQTIFSTKDSWSAYKLGRYAACQGEWSTAAFIFENLEGTIDSYIYKMWFKSLVRFAHSERTLQLLKLSGGSNSSSYLEINNKHIQEACSSFRSSEKAVAAILKSGCTLFFSKWFLNLRAKVIENVAEILKLRSLPLTEASIENSRPGDDCNFTSLAYVLAQVSSQFSRLAREYDMMATSFMGLDKKSLEIILENALCCSLLAFSTGFSLFFPHSQSNDVTKKSEECLPGMLIQDLAWRLQHRDYDLSAKFGFLLRFCKRPKSSSMQCSTQLHSTSLETNHLIAACKYAVSEVVVLQKEANGVHIGDKNLIVHVSQKSLQLLVDIIAKLMSVPFRAPSNFFRVRPCILSELIVSNSDTRIGSEGISVMQGSQLTLDLCLQLKNTPVGLQMQSIKLYCIIYCKTSFKVNPATLVRTSAHTHWGCQDWEGDDMVYANEKLLRHIYGSNQKTTNDGVIRSFIRFELNEKGQAFSSCLFDVSGLSVGCYRTQWLSCCVDGEGNYWSLLPLNAGPVFTIRRGHLER